VTSTCMTRSIAAAVAAATLLSAGCGEFARQSQSPSQLVVLNILGSRGSSATTTTSFASGPLTSDIPGANETVFNDLGQATLSLMLRDANQTAAPTTINSVTVTRYRVVYRRSDGLNTPGMHVPYPFDGVVTATVLPGTNTPVVFEVVRHNAKREAPLATLAVNPQVLTTFAEVTFFGRDQAGNEVSATGNLQINFGAFI
jgi:hypothetical protein